MAFCGHSRYRYICALGIGWCIVVDSWRWKRFATHACCLLYGGYIVREPRGAASIFGYIAHIVRGSCVEKTRPGRTCVYVWNVLRCSGELLAGEQTRRSSTRRTIGDSAGSHPVFIYCPQNPDLIPISLSREPVWSPVATCWQGYYILCSLLIGSSLAGISREPPPPQPASRNSPEERWLDVRLNHFIAYNNDTFRMRFYYNDEFATSQGSHIVIVVGGEWEITQGWVTGGLAWNVADLLQAGLFYTEHRYYGMTRPTEDTSVSNLRYLTVDQSLADLAQFIDYVRSDEFENGLYKGGKVVLVGCSYAGSMATWMRLGYPHLVDAAFSDSGPLHAQEDFPEYLEVVTDALRTQGSQECVDSIQQAMQRIVGMLETQEGANTVSNMFSTCTPIQASSPMDVATFFWYSVTESFAYLVQYATPGQIPDACAILTNPSVADPVQRLANFITTKSWNQPCIETRYTQVVARHSNTSYDAEDSVMRLWTYQTCVEYGWYQTTTSSNQPFLSTVPLQYFHQMCQDFFTGFFNEALLRSGIARTNILFAGLTHLPDYVISVAGGHDPWSPMGPQEEHATAIAPVFYVPGISHCRAMSTLGSTENSELEAVKREVVSLISLYITGHRTENRASVTGGSLALITTLLLRLLTL